MSPAINGMGKAQEYYRSIKDERRAWADSMPQVCMYTGERFKWPGRQIHEIERRSQAPKTCFHPCNYLLLSESAHAGPFAAMPHAEQLCIKLWADPEHFCLKTWLMLKDPLLRAPKRVTMEEILFEYEKRYGEPFSGPVPGLALAA